MNPVQIIPGPPPGDSRLAPVLVEERLGHYREFRDFFVRSFVLDRIGLERPGYVRAVSGGVYALVFLGRSGEAFPSGVEIHAVVPALEPLDNAVVDRDLWSILCWMVEGVGGAWTVESLRATARLFRVPAAGLD